MSQLATEQPAFPILSFIGDKEDAGSHLKPHEAAAKIDREVAIKKATKELIDRHIDEIEPLDPDDDTGPLYQCLLKQTMQWQEQSEDSLHLSDSVRKFCRNHKTDDPTSSSEQMGTGRETRSSRRAASKAQDEGQSETKRPVSKIEPIDSMATDSSLLKRKKQDDDSDSDPDEPSKESISRTDLQNQYQSKSVLKCIGIMPSMAHLMSPYSDSSDDSSDSSDEDYDLAPLVTRVARKAKKEHHEG